MRVRPVVLIGRELVFPDGYIRRMTWRERLLWRLGYPESSEVVSSPFPEPASALDDFRERRELQGLGDSDGLGSDPTLEPSSLALRDPRPDWKRAGLLRAQKAENDEHSFGL